MALCHYVTSVNIKKLSWLVAISHVRILQVIADHVGRVLFTVCVDDRQKLFIKIN